MMTRFLGQDSSIAALCDDGGRIVAFVDARCFPISSSGFGPLEPEAGGGTEVPQIIDPAAQVLFSEGGGV